MIETRPEDFQGLRCEPKKFYICLINLIADCEFLMAQSRGLESVHKPLDEAHTILVDVLKEKGW